MRKLFMSSVNDDVPISFFCGGLSDLWHRKQGKLMHENRRVKFRWGGDRLKITLWACVFIFLSLTTVSKAQNLCPQPHASLYYDCDTVPEESPAGPWEIWNPEEATWYSDGVNLYIDAYESEGHVEFYRVEESLVTAEKYEIEVNTHIVNYPPCPWICFNLAFGATDGEKAFLVWAGDPSDNRLWLPTPEVGYFVDGIDWSTPASYRVVVDRTSPDPEARTVTIYVDGISRLTIPYSELADHPGDFPPEIPPHGFGIGGYLSDTVWDYISYEVCGPDVFGCIKLKGSPLVGSKVVLKQKDEKPQNAKTDANGCYKFGSIVSGKKFEVTIGGPKVR